MALDPVLRRAAGPTQPQNKTRRAVWARSITAQGRVGRYLPHGELERCGTIHGRDTGRDALLTNSASQSSRAALCSQHLALGFWRRTVCPVQYLDHRLAHVQVPIPCCIVQGSTSSSTSFAQNLCQRVKILSQSELPRGDCMCIPKTRACSSYREWVGLCGQKVETDAMMTFPCRPMERSVSVPNRIESRLAGSGRAERCGMAQPSLVKRSNVKALGEKNLQRIQVTIPCCRHSLLCQPLSWPSVERASMFVPWVHGFDPSFVKPARSCGVL